MGTKFLTPIVEGLYMVIFVVALFIIRIITAEKKDCMRGCVNIVGL